MELRLKLNEFKVLYRQLKRGIPWLDHLILGVLVWLEEKFIDLRVESTISTAIEEYNAVDTTPSGVPDPIYTEIDSPTSELLPEMRLEAPWRRE